MIEPEQDFRYTTRFIGAGGTVLHTSSALESSYRFAGHERYVRAQVVDSMGRVAWVQPVFPGTARR